MVVCGTVLQASAGMGEMPLAALSLDKPAINPANAVLPTCFRVQAPKHPLLQPCPNVFGRHQTHVLVFLLSAGTQRVASILIAPPQLTRAR